MKRSFAWLTFAILVLSLAGGFVANSFVRPRQSVETRATWLMKSGKFAEAEALYWNELTRGNITVPMVIAFLDTHRLGAITLTKVNEDSQLETFAQPGKKNGSVFSTPEQEVDAFFEQATLPHDVKLLGDYWRNTNEIGAAADQRKREVEQAADATPPMPWANHLLARAAWRGDKEEEAARRYEREATSFDRKEDIDAALQLYETSGDWEKVGQHLADPRVDRLASAWTHFRYGIETRRWGMALHWSWAATYGLRFAPGPLVLALISALAWFVLAARLGRMTEHPLQRVPLYLASFGLGLLSVYFTDVLIALQESILHLEHTGETMHDLLYFFFGVGFREELSKLVCFLPLLPLLLRRENSKLEVVVCGALVGLGFAAVENLLYFERDDLGSAMARFLTANFLHMAMTALTASALMEAVREPDKHAFEFSTTLLTVMALHGAYDFFISAKGGLAYLSMGVFIFLSRSFMNTVNEARKKVGRGLPILHVFLLGTAVVVGASFIYASALVGPAAASALLFEGMIGLFIVIYFFVQEFRSI